ncbi:MAG: PAS domain-containing protein, partial [Chitinophagales bacterium]
RTGNYLEQSSGKPSHNLLKMAKHGLAFELRAILNKSKKNKAAVSKENISFKVNDAFHNLTIEAIPLPGKVETYHLILFHDQPAINVLNSSEKHGLQAKSKNDNRDLLIQQLERELLQANDDIRSTGEDQEAANEELLSSSEELQSLNEELETSNEELQSSNEELSVVNQEIIHLNEQIAVARDYAEAIVSTIREPLIVLDKHLRVKTANSSYYQLFRVNEADTAGGLIYEVNNKQWNIPALRRLLEKILPEKSTFRNFELTHTFSGIGERVLLLNAREIINESDAEKLILLAMEDVTDERRHHLYEKELLARFQNFVMHAPVAICILKGADYIMELANDFYLQIMGKGQEIIGKSLLQSFPEFKDQGIKELLDGVMKSGKPFHGNEWEVQVARNNRTEKAFFNFVYQPVREKGDSVTGIIVTFNEVTDQVIARKRMEAQAAMVRNLLMTAPGFVCTLSGPDHVYEVVNERYQQLFGKRKIQGKPMLEALPELVGQEFDKLLDKVYNTGEPYVGIEIPITLARDEGLMPELRYFNFSYQPMYNEHDSIYSILVFGYEVTEEVNAKNKNIAFQQQHTRNLEDSVKQRTFELSEANEKLLLKNDELIRINKELQSFAYVSSHDLQEPLRKIQTFSNRILEKENQNLSEMGKDYFNRLQLAAGRMQQLIEDLLAFSRISTAHKNFEETDLRKILDDVIVDLKESIEEKQASLEIDVDCIVKVIPFQFRQLINNLICNALKFTLPGTLPHIEVRCTLESGDIINSENIVIVTGRFLQGKNYHHLSVSDNGIGFEMEFSHRIFEVFQKLHRKEDYPGTGIGLAIVKRIVENHSGIIRVESEPGKGATFHIYLLAN